MEIRTLVSVLEQPHLAADHLHGWGLADVCRGQRVLLDLAEMGLSLDVLADLCRQLGEHLPQLIDADGTLAAFSRYLFAVRSPLSFVGLLEREPAALPTLLAALSQGPRWAELLIEDPEAFDLLLASDAELIDEARLLAELSTEIEAFTDEGSLIAALARFRGRHLLRIAYGEVAGDRSLDTAMQQLSELHRVLIAAALKAALQRAGQTRPLPPRVAVNRLPCGVIALGLLGRNEADYAPPLDLLLVYDSQSAESALLPLIHEYFDRVARLFARLLTESVGDAPPISVTLLTLPGSSTAAAAHCADDVVIGFDSFGRTWHRQEMLYARPVAGDLDLCSLVLARLQPWLFRRYLSRADETGIKALKRRILSDANIHQDDWRDVRVARGGLNNFEATIEFLQLLVGGEDPSARQSSLLAAISGLQQAAALTSSERSVLEQGYRFLRSLEHRLQIAIGGSATELPRDDLSLRHIAAMIGPGAGPDALKVELRRHLDNCWKVQRRLLDEAFEEDGPVSREVELLLAPAPPPEEIRAALAPFGFHDPQQALQSLNDLAEEQVPFLSTRRCRHLLSLSLPRLLTAVAATPDPDKTLDHLVRVSNSLGGKGVLWDLFRFHPPSLDLYVRLCAASPYLSDVLTANPGMMDELIDSLQLDKLPTRASLDATLSELCRGVANTSPVLHDFKNAEHLRIGVRDILGKEDIDHTHAALADVAEACLAHVAELEHSHLVEKYGVPTVGDGELSREPAHFVMVALGKLGGREPNYHSQLDVLFLYDADGVTQPTGHSRRQERTANNHFFTQLAQRVLKQLSELTAKGRLYAIDALLRPIGMVGTLALPLSDLVQHFSSNTAPLWQWQTLCQARPVFGDDAARDRVKHEIKQLLQSRSPQKNEAAAFRARRQELERGASPQNLKRGPGGTIDVEFVVQFLQLQHAAELPGELIPNTQVSIRLLADAGVLDRAAAERIEQSYRFLRRVESGLRLLETPARHDLPADPTEMARLALLLGHGNPDRLREQCLQHMAENRAEFDRVVR